MLPTLFMVIVLVFFMICIWSGFEIFLEKRKQDNLPFSSISQVNEDNQ